MVFGQVVIGPPGSGKTTYCEGMVQYLSALGRQVAVVNLDPANETLPYEAAADIRSLISLKGASEQCGLGPNGALIYCLEYLEANFDWLEEQFRALSEHYVLIDMPGQVELYTCHKSVRTVVQRLIKLNHRLTAVHLVDAHHCADPAKFISVLLVTLSTMVQLELPQVNVLSKVDLVEAYGNLDFSLDFYTDVLDPSRLLPLLQQSHGNSSFAERHASLNARIVELVEDFSLVNFATLNISDKDSVSRVLQSIDKANGYVFGASDLGADVGIFTCAAGVPEWDDERVGSVQERYMRDTDLSELLEPGGAKP
ncbi:hypothetical protein AB1Y20_000442 [Prymnesium parvum]|uniref:GPN-loop GTPase 2 n=1 Tax=Prymnesium parvum TaxID=97485 RepID=A0AB34K927_PRYPA